MVVQHRRSYGADFTPSKAEMTQEIFLAAKALIVKNSRFLALKRSDDATEYWDIPGGRMELGEKLEDTLRREVYEETALRAKPVRVIGSWDMILESRQISGVIYHCIIESGEIQLSDEHCEFSWFSEKDVDRLYPVLGTKLKDILPAMIRGTIQ